jgi:restriction system protein
LRIFPLCNTKLAAPKPVAPIRRIEREDPRFIKAREVLDEQKYGRNLLTIGWKDCEMLVRNLFEKIFAGGETEMHVTRASRDEGVGAVVIYPNPLKGGKTIIQANSSGRRFLWPPFANSPALCRTNALAKASS